MIWTGHFSSYFNKKIVQRYDLLRGFKLLGEDALNMIQNITESNTLQPAETKGLETIMEEIQSNIDMARQQMNDIAKEMPTSYQIAANEKAKRLLLSKERDIIRDMNRSGMLNEDEENEMLNQVDKSKIGRAHV